VILNAPALAVLNGLERVGPYVVSLTIVWNSRATISSASGSLRLPTFNADGALPKHLGTPVLSPRVLSEDLLC
jgi:hypothetical protein